MIEILIIVVFILVVFLSMTILFVQGHNNNIKCKNMSVLLIFFLILFFTTLIGYYINIQSVQKTWEPRTLSFSQVIYLSDTSYMFLTKNNNKVYLSSMEFESAPKIIIDTQSYRMYVKWLQKAHTNKEAEIHISQNALGDFKDSFIISK